MYFIHMVCDYHINILVHQFYMLSYFFIFIEHSIPIDTDKVNREIIEQDYNLWDALESSKWIPCDTIELCY